MTKSTDELVKAISPKKKNKPFTEQVKTWFTTVALPYTCATVVVAAAVDDGVRRIQQLNSIPTFLQGALSLFITAIVLQNAVKVVKKK